MVWKDGVANRTVSTGYGDHTDAVLTNGERGRDKTYDSHVTGKEEVGATYSVGLATNLSGKNSFTPLKIRSEIVLV